MKKMRVRQGGTEDNEGSSKKGLKMINKGLGKKGLKMIRIQVKRTEDDKDSG
jgi:hypothetical protein